MCDKLVTRLQTGRCSKDKTAIIDVVAEVHDVQFYWSLNSPDVDESESSKLLKDIITLWVTIRGFSITSAWMEAYKCATKTTKEKQSQKRIKGTSQ